MLDEYRSFLWIIFHDIQQGIKAVEKEMGINLVLFL